MNGRLLSAAEPASLRRAAAALVDGDVVAVPTDTVYGLAVDPTQPEAVARLFALKGRPEDVPLPVLVAGPEQLALVAGELEVAAAELAAKFWPGPLTLVVPRRAEFTVDLGGPPAALQTVGVRRPDHPVVVALCELLGPLAVTSANRHGQQPATMAAQVASVFPGPDGPAVILDGGTCDGIPSTVVECRGPAARCLREGAISWSLLYGNHRPGDPGAGTAGSGWG
jgi:L-threonylcarbamoyladenylate synthase